MIGGNALAQVTKVKRPVDDLRYFGAIRYLYLLSCNSMDCENFRIPMSRNKYLSDGNRTLVLFSFMHACLQYMGCGRRSIVGLFAWYLETLRHRIVATGGRSPSSSFQYLYRMFLKVERPQYTLIPSFDDTTTSAFFDVQYISKVCRISLKKGHQIPWRRLRLLL